MKVWDSDGAFLDFPSSAKEPMFHIVENDLMVHSLSERLLRCDNVEVQYGRGVKGIKAARSGTEGDLVEVTLDSPGRNFSFFLNPCTVSDILLLVKT